MTSSNKQNLDQLVADQCLKLFSDYQLQLGVGVPRDALVDRQFLLCSVIGFTAKHMRGALVLATTSEPLERTNPAETRSHRDWICELSNQLLGRVKNQLLHRRVEVHPSTPVALCGDHLSPILQQQQLVAELFTAGGGAVGVWMDCEFDEGFELPDDALVDAAPVAEGEMLLF